MESAIHEMKEWDKYGMRRDGKRVHFPQKCTPLMSEKKMLPLPNRQSAGVSRPRYLGNDCNIYEWDFEGGLFEKYVPNSKVSSYTHVGEVTAITKMERPGKADSKRDHDAGDTGIPGYDMKALCKEHKAGNLNMARFEKNSKAKNLLKCI
jgi:hypothetical protein